MIMGTFDMRQTATQTRHADVQEWTQVGDILDKDFIIVPERFYELDCWLLAIICFPSLKGLVTTRNPPRPESASGWQHRRPDKLPALRQSLIRMFDSLGPTPSRLVIATLRNYLTCVVTSKAIKSRLRSTRKDSGTLRPA
ncbi:blast:Sentrin-specific protease 6 [Drosophila guanche]|uniref:Blast:Sentrin-specific protease 6 n=1 Tax=Drosophila guanche TaxID=7266 RepID=A0A3B0JZS8_DROGU|nr:blast:Sentrin-specific protease 6 [Drosophila guanche]